MSFVEILKVIVLGIVEGFTEWLPISSTGHMILVDEIIHLDVSEAYREVFMVVIQPDTAGNPLSGGDSASDRASSWRGEYYFRSGGRTWRCIE